MDFSPVIENEKEIPVCDLNAFQILLKEKEKPQSKFISTGCPKIDEFLK